MIQKWKLKCFSFIKNKTIQFSFQSHFVWMNPSVKIWFLFSKIRKKNKKNPLVVRGWGYDTALSLCSHCVGPILSCKVSPIRNGVMTLLPTMQKGLFGGCLWVGNVFPLWVSRRRVGCGVARPAMLSSDIYFPATPKRFSPTLRPFSATTPSRRKQPSPLQSLEAKLSIDG